MKSTFKRIFTLLLTLIFFLNCQKDEEVQLISGSNIIFTKSPIDLNGVNAKFAKNIAYDSKERTQFDIWLPESEKPTGLVIYAHGGGFSSGDKDYVYSVQMGGNWDFPNDIRFLLQNNIAFATVRYTLLNYDKAGGVRTPISDVSRCL